MWSVTYCDIYSGWTANRAVWNKGSGGVVAATREVEAALPFELLGFDTDNGSEFLNWHLLRYFQERPKAVGFTRSRPYKKDDNGHVEQKNWTHVRQLLGYDRLGEPELVEPINALYRECWEPLHNYFLPSAKLEQKSREGAKVKRRHDKPLTPCERLLGSSDVDAASKRKLRDQRSALNPFELHRRLEEGLRAPCTPPPPAKLPSKKWRDVILKVWHTDPLICPHCQNRMRVLAVIDQRKVIEKILRHLNLWTGVRAFLPSRGPPIAIPKHWEVDDPQSRDPFPGHDNVFTD